MERATLIVLMLVLPAIDLVILAVGAIGLKSFKTKHPKIATQKDLTDFKSMVKVQKYLALLSIPILWAPSAIFALGLFVWDLGLFDLIYAIGPSLVIVGAAKLMGGLQASVEELPVATDELRAERDRVIQVWKHQALPDW